MDTRPIVAVIVALVTGFVVAVFTSTLITGDSAGDMLLRIVLPIISGGGAGVVTLSKK
jgi:Na+/citrate or Na+/malate symporter